MEERWRRYVSIFVYTILDILKNTIRYVKFILFLTFKISKSMSMNFQGISICDRELILVVANTFRTVCLVQVTRVKLYFTKATGKPRLLKANTRVSKLFMML